MNFIKFLKFIKCEFSNYDLMVIMLHVFLCDSWGICEYDLYICIGCLKYLGFIFRGFSVTLKQWCQTFFSAGNFWHSFKTLS